MSYINFDKKYIIDLRNSEQPYIDVSLCSTIANGIDLANSTCLLIRASKALANIEILRLANCRHLQNVDFLGQLPMLQVLDVRGCSSEIQRAAAQRNVRIFYFDAQ